MAGNDTEGLRYGVIEHAGEVLVELDGGLRSRRSSPLDTALTQLCSKERLLELIHDFIVFDAGIKKTCRHNQYFGVQGAPRSESTITTAGSSGTPRARGKSLTMVWLAKWIREHVSTAPGPADHRSRPSWTSRSRRSSRACSEDIYRTKSGADLVLTARTRTRSR